MSENIIVYDVETQKTFAEVGGRESQSKLLVSFLGLYSYSQQKYFSFFEKDLPKLEAIFIKERPTVIGYNSIHFDNKVVQPYFKNLKIDELPQIDIMAELYDQLGFRLKLESVAQATLGEGKSGTGLDAIKYFREGNFKDLEKYCLDDVRITKELYEFGKFHGYLLYTSGGDLHKVEASWAQDETISKQLKQALDKHQRLKITYLKITDTEKTKLDTEIDLLAMDEKYVRVFCHVNNQEKKYAIHRILNLETTDQNYAYQASLL